MLQSNAATQKQLDDITGAISVLERQINAVNAQKSSIYEQSTVVDEQISQVDESLRKCRVAAPISGTILVKYAERGELAITGKPLFRIADLGTLFLRVYVDGEQLTALKTGQAVKVLVDRQDGNMKNLTGTISWISPEAEFTPKIIQTRKERVNMVYAVKVLVKNDGYLKIGMPGEVKFN
jgi:HlyD family secretion protein